MFEALGWGILAASSLVVGEVIAAYVRVPRRILGLILAFGVGVLISAVSFELVDEAFRSANSSWTVSGGLLAGSLVFFGGDQLIGRMGSRRHKKQGAAEPRRDNSGAAILLGTVLDGIPESIVIGLTLVKGGAVSAAMVVAVFLSNLPEAIGATSGLRAEGWKRWQTMGLWLAVALASGVASLAGFAFFDTADPHVLAFTLSFAAGALLTMLADSMMPEAYRDSGPFAGMITVLGFCLAYAISALT